MIFKLEIHTRTAGFGERPDQEQKAIADILTRTAHHIATGHAPIPIKDNAGNVVGSYEFSSGALNYSSAHHPKATEPPAGLQPRDMPH